MAFSREQWADLLTTGGGFLDVEPENHDAAVGMRLGAFEITEHIGDGGMASVYRARRCDDQFEQDVAIKILHRGLSHDDHGERFRQERQILAALEHPGIARILDGGLTEDDRLYLVMEYIDGGDLLQYAEGLDWRGRVALLSKIARAVRAAHRQLVVHGDLKPGNVLISKRGEPKLLDFGIASVQSDTVDDKSGAIPMTPLYAAPEQIAGERITTATDIYQLGLLLLEVLSGEHPLRALSSDIGQINLIISKGEIPIPTTVPGVPNGKWRELRAIIRDCLSVRADDRYGSVDALIDDLRQCLDGQAVAAVGKDRAYLFGRWIAGHKVLAVATLAVGALAVTSTWYWVRIERERIRAEQNEVRADAVSAMAGRLIDSVDPLAGDGAEGEVIGSFNFEIRPSEAPPGVQRELIMLSTRAMMNLGRFSEVIETVQPVVDQIEAREEARSTDYAEYLSLLGYAHYRNGEVNLGRELLLKAYQLQQDKAEAMALAQTEQRLGLVERRLGNLQRALELMQAAANKLGEQLQAPHEQLARIESHLGLILTDLKQFDQAIAHLRGAVDQYEQLGEHGMLAAMTLGNLANAERLAGHQSEALVHARASVAAARTVQRSNPQLLATALSTDGNVQMSAGQTDLAVERYREALDIYLEQLGEDHPRVGLVSHNLAVGLRLLGRCDEALPLYQRSILIASERLGADHPEVTESKRQARLCSADSAD